MEYICGNFYCSLEAPFFMEIIRNDDGDDKVKYCPFCGSPKLEISENLDSKELF